jgi:hypothetical protein
LARRSKPKFCIRSISPCLREVSAL